MKSGKLPYMIIIQKYSKINDKDCLVEEAHFEERISDEHLLSAHIIIDILNGKVVKSRDEREESVIVEEYNKKYSEKIIQAVRNFFIKNSEMWKNFIEEANKLAKELEKNNTKTQ